MTMSLKLLIRIVTIGLLTAGAWLFGFSYIFSWAYAVLDSPDEPTFYLWVALIIVSLLFGAVGGWFAPGTFIQNILKVGMIFLGVLIVAIIVGSYAFSGMQGVRGQLSSVGFWALVVGATVSIGFGNRTRRAA